MNVMEWLDEYSKRSSIYAEKITDSKKEIINNTFLDLRVFYNFNTMDFALIAAGCVEHSKNEKKFESFLKIQTKEQLKLVPKDDSLILSKSVIKSHLADMINELRTLKKKEVASIPKQGAEETIMDQIRLMMYFGKIEVYCEFLDIDMWNYLDDKDVLDLFNLDEI